MDHDGTAWPRRLAAAVAALGIVLPPAGVAGALVGPGSAVFASVVAGVWLLKGILIAHAAALWLAPRLGTADAPRALLAGPGPADPARSRGAAPSAGDRVAILLGLLAGALAVRLPELDAGLWFDEVRTLVAYVRPSAGEILATYDTTNQHMLYSLAAKLSTGAFGEGAATLRLPAVAFGVASVWATWWFGRRFVSDREALLAAGLLALSYHHVWFSQNARGYTALLFWTLVSTALFVDILRTTSFSWRPVVAYAVATALGMYTHPTAGAVWVSHAVVAGGLSLRDRGSGVRAARRSAWVALLLGVSLTTLLYAPVIPQMLDTLSAPTMPGVDVVWEHPAWLLTESVSGLAEGLPGGTITLAAGSLVFLAGLVGWARRAPAVAVAMFLPAVLVLAAALARSHNLWPRFFFFSAGFGALVLVRGVFEVVRPVGGKRARTAATVVVLLLVAGSALTVPRAWGPKQDFRGTDAFLAEARRPGDAVVALDLTELPLRVYLGGDYLAVDSRDDLLRVESAHRRTWVVYVFPTRVAGLYPDLWRRMRREYRRVAEFPGTLRGGSIVVVRRS